MKGIAMDLYFYDLNFKLLRILPPNEYISANFTVEYNGNGKLEISFIDNTLTNCVKQETNGIIVLCSDFQGIITSWIDDEKKLTVYGYSLNYLLHRHIVLGLETDETVSGTVKNIVYSKILQLQDSGFFTWLTIEDTDRTGSTIDYSIDNTLYADEWIQQICEKDKCGYSVTADVKNKKYIFNILQTSENPIMLSENNLNAYEITVDGDNNGFATGGWYKQKYADIIELDASTGKDADGNTVTSGSIQNFAKRWKVTAAGTKPISGLKTGDIIGCESEQGTIIKIPDNKSGFWYHITNDTTAAGINIREVVLSSDNMTEAIAELSEKKNTLNTDLKTRNINYGIDYKLGDIVRVQIKSTTVKKLVESIFISYEGISKVENPDFTDWS